MKRGVRTILILIALFFAVRIQQIKIFVQENRTKRKKKFSNDYINNSIISLVENILTSDWFLNAGSFDQIGQFNFNANAKKGMSLSCGEISFVSDSNDLENSSGIILMSFANSLNTGSVSFKDNLEYFEIEILISDSSFQQCSGEYNSKSNNFEFIIINCTGLFLKKDINTFVSTTNFIHHPSFFSFSHALCLISSPILRASSSNSFSDSNCFSICSFQANCLALDSMQVLTNLDQLISGNFFICSLTSSGTDNVIDTILFVEKHKNVELFKLFDLIMTSELKNQISLFKNILSKSSVVSTGISDCSLRCGSLDQIAELVDDASARKSISSKSEITIEEFSRKFSYSNALKNLIDFSTSFCLISNSCLESLDFNKHSSLCSLNSDLINSGAKNSALIDANKYAEVDLGLIIENKTLLSNTNLILVPYKYSFLFSGDMLFNSFSLVSGEISFNNCLNLPFFVLLPISTDHLINSCSSSECNLFNNCSACFLRSNNIVLISSDQFTQENSDISAFNSSSTANVMDAIYSFPLAFNSSNFLSSLILSDTTRRATAATFTSGNSFLNFANNSSGIDTVTLGILDNSGIYFDTSKDVQVFKLFDLIMTSELNKNNIVVND